jgi:hypothetical protein
VSILDGDKENLDAIPRYTISPYAFQGYTFRPSTDPENLPQRVALRFVFKEKELNHARLEVYQVSTGTWHPFEIDTQSSDDQYIDVTLDMSAVLTTAQDLAEVQVHFYASEDGDGKAEVDYVGLLVHERAYAPVDGGMAKPHGFDLDKVTSYPRVRHQPLCVSRLHLSTKRRS